MRDLSRTEYTNRCIAFYLFSMMAAIYLLTSSGTILNDVGQLRIEVANSIFERFNVSIPAGKGLTGPDGRDYSMFGIGSVLVALPLYAIGKVTGSFQISAVAIMNQLFAAATVTLVYFFVNALSYTRRTSVLVSIIFGLTTFLWYYAKQDSDHIIETFFSLLSVYKMYKYVSDNKVRFLLQSGAAMGMAILTRPSSLLILPPLLLMHGLFFSRNDNVASYMKLTARDGLLLFIAMLPFLVIACCYNYARFGNPLETGYTLMAERLKLDFFTGTPLRKGLAGFLISPGKGFFFYTPSALLFFFSFRSFSRRQPRVAASFILIIMSYLLFLSKNIYWHGDWAWGPRYLLVITPYFLIPIAAILDSDAWKTRVLIRKGVYVLIGISLIIQLLAISVNHNKYFIYLQSVKNVNFTVAYGTGVQPILEPPLVTYFTWSMSPILAQMRFIREISGNLKTYRYHEPPVNASHNEKTNSIIAINIFDFWWIYRYYAGGDKTGFTAAGAICLWAFYSAIMLRRFVRKSVPISDI